MAKPKAEEFGRDVSIRVRQAKVSNLNTKPEKAGTDLVKRADLSIEFLLRTEELPHLLNVAGGAESLWDKNGEPIILELDGPIHLNTVIVGVAKIGHKKGECDEFETAKLKKISIEPMLETQVTVRAQVRVEPGRVLDMLYDLVIDRACKFGFVGKVLLKGDDEDVDDDDNQQELPV